MVSAHQESLQSLNNILMAESGLVENKTGNWSLDEGKVGAGGLALKIFSVLVAVTSLYVFVVQLSFCVIWFCKASDAKDRSKRISNILCVFSSFATFLRIGVGIALVTFRGNLTDSLCNRYYDFKVAMYAIAYISLWTVLWLRQRYFYHSSNLRDLYSPFIRVISNGIEVFVVVGVLASTIYYYFTRSYLGGVTGCREVTDNSGSFIWAVDFVSIFLLQSILLALFVYPLWSHKRRLRRSNTCASRSSKNNTSSPLTEALVRSTVTSGVCMFVNLASVPIQYVVTAKFGSVFDILYDLSLLLQLVAVIVLYKNWRTRFFPWLILVDRKQGSATNLSSTRNLQTYSVSRDGVSTA